MEFGVKKLNYVVKLVDIYLVTKKWYLNNSVMSFVACTEQEDNLLKLKDKVSKFCQSEEILPKKLYSLEEKLCQQYFDRTTKRNEDGRFIVCLPFRDSLQN